MRLLSHTHINGNGIEYRDEYARILARACRKRNYTHCVVGCHGSYIASKGIMKEIKKLGITPIRFAELDISVRNVSKYKTAHIAFINIPEAPIEGYVHSKEGVDIDRVIPYAKKVNCRIVLCHPYSADEIRVFSDYIDGYELTNGLETRSFSDRDVSKEFPHLVQFSGADWHVWEGAGDPSYFTELPDDWFGELYA
jgi:hypothetical protein